MFRLRNIMAVVLVISLICGGLIGCAPAAPPEVVAPPPPAPLKPCSVELSGVYLSTAGGVPAFGSGSTDMVVKIPEFIVSNPNDYMVTIDGFRYEIDVGQGLNVSEGMPSKYWIPAGEEISLDGFACFPWNTLFQAVIGKELGDMGKAMTATLPLWKGLGGPRPDIMYYGHELTVDKDTWKAVEATKVVYKWEVKLHTSGEGMDKYSSYSGSL